MLPDMRNEYKFEPVRHHGHRQWWRSEGHLRAHCEPTAISKRSMYLLEETLQDIFFWRIEEEQQQQQRIRCLVFGDERMPFPFRKPFRYYLLFNKESRKKKQKIARTPTKQNIYLSQLHVDEGHPEASRWIVWPLRELSTLGLHTTNWFMYAI